MNVKEELEELYNVKRMVESGEFQKYFAEPLYKELEDLKPAYDCDSLKELHTLKGKKQGLELFTGILKSIPTLVKNKEYERDAS